MFRCTNESSITAIIHTANYALNVYCLYMEWIIGVDEAGRGPLAGPVYAASFAVRRSFHSTHAFKKFIRGVKDSKQTSKNRREKWLGKIKDLEETGNIKFAFHSSSNKSIDKGGIELSIKECVERSLSGLGCRESSEVLLDGRLKAPSKFRNSKTIIRGDEKIPVISLASIIAKVTRDEYMKEQSEKFPEYGFETNVGYGTPSHIEAIKKNGISPIHRKSFCGSIRY